MPTDPRLLLVQKYLSPYFVEHEEMFPLDGWCVAHKMELMLRTMHFYDAHTINRELALIKQPIANFEILITFSIIERIMKTEETEKDSGSWNRIDSFFNKYAHRDDLGSLNNMILAYNTSKKPIRVLYDMRNNFVHNAQWFRLLDIDDEGFAMGHRIITKDDEYCVKIKMNLEDYLKLFFRAYISFFRAG